MVADLLRRPERWALVFAVLVVAGGLIGAVVDAAGGVARSEITYAGRFDADEVRAPMYWDPRTLAARPPSGEMAYLSGGTAVFTDPTAEPSLIAMWALQVIAPWLLAAAVLAALVPSLRAAERGDPFAGSGPGLQRIGVVLLAGIPAIALLRYAVAEAGTSGTSQWPFVTPVLTLSLTQLLPGLLVLVLAGVISAGARLRDFERHTV